jgi:hypothetical protein
MSSSSLHPLAGQAVALSSRADCYGWAFGLTNCLAFRDPLGCVRWTLDHVMPRVQTTGEYVDAGHRSVRFLEGVLSEPGRGTGRSDASSENGGRYRYRHQGITLETSQSFTFPSSPTVAATYHREKRRPK